jgi:hypothetical protein
MSLIFRTKMNTKHLMEEEPLLISAPNEVWDEAEWWVSEAQPGVHGQMFASFCLIQCPQSFFPSGVPQPQPWRPSTYAQSQIESRHMSHTEREDAPVCQRHLCNSSCSIGLRGRPEPSPSSASTHRREPERCRQHFPCLSSRSGNLPKPRIVT